MNEKELEKEIERYCGARGERPVPDFIEQVARHFAEFGESNAFKGYVILLPEVYRYYVDKAKMEAVEEYAERTGRPKIYRGEMLVLKTVAEKDGICLQELAKKLEPFVID